MSFADFKDNTMRAVVSKTIDGVLKYVNKHDDRTEALLKLTDLSEKLMDIILFNSVLHFKFIKSSFFNSPTNP